MENTIYKAPQGQATHSMIWMHGLGANAQDMMMLADAMQLGDVAVRYAFMNAPVRFVTINNNMPMPAWYDITGMDLSSREDRVGIVESQTRISQIIANEIAQGVPSENIYLAGFSQGGAMALYAGLHCEQSLGGIIALSAYLPLREEFAAASLSQAKALPIFMAAGEQDPIVFPGWTESSKQHLQSIGYENIEYHTYPMEHAVCPQEIGHLAAWFKQQLV